MIDNLIVKAWQVLVVDDEPDSLEIVTRILSFHGATVKTVSAGIAALQILEKLTPTIVIMDLSMPDMDGWEMLYRLKNNSRLENVPIVALTAHAMKGDRERALSAGFHQYLTKPLSPLSFFDDLLAALADAGGGHRNGSKQLGKVSGSQNLAGERK